MLFFSCRGLKASLNIRSTTMMTKMLEHLTVRPAGSKAQNESGTFKSHIDNKLVEMVAFQPFESAEYFPKSHHFMQRVEFTVAFLNGVLSAIHQHFNFEDLKGRKGQCDC